MNKNEEKVSANKAKYREVVISYICLSIFFTIAAVVQFVNGNGFKGTGEIALIIMCVVFTSSVRLDLIEGKQNDAKRAFVAGVILGVIGNILILCT